MKGGEIMEKLRSKALGCAIVLSTLTPIAVFAEGDVSADVAGALQTTASSITGVLGAVAPVALGIVGVFLAWRYGMRFFKSLSK